MSEDGISMGGKELVPPSRYGDALYNEVRVTFVVDEAV